MTVLRPKDWEDFQHYSNRRPPWIKLHRSLLDDPSWFLLPHFEARLLPELWLIASEDDAGRLPPVDELAWRMRREPEEVASAVQELVNKGWLEGVEGEEREAAPVVVPTPKKKAKKKGGRRSAPDSYPDWFEELWDARPRRDGSESKVDTWRRITKPDGTPKYPLEVMRQGLDNYRAFLKRKGKLETEFVMTPERFFGPGDHWRTWAEKRSGPRREIL